MVLVTSFYFSIRSLAVYEVKKKVLITDSECVTRLRDTPHKRNEKIERYSMKKKVK